MKARYYEVTKKWYETQKMFVRRIEKLKGQIEDLA